MCEERQPPPYHFNTLELEIMIEVLTMLECIFDAVL
jgi:hypothetical protein